MCSDQAWENSAVESKNLYEFNHDHRLGKDTDCIVPNERHRHLARKNAP